MEDGEGNIWAGTTGGLHRLSRRPLTPLDVGFVVATADTRDGVFAATWTGLMQLEQREGAGPRNRGAHQTISFSPSTKTDTAGCGWRPTGDSTRYRVAGSKRSRRLVE
jgi:hypothetical protein